MPTMDKTLEARYQQLRRVYADFASEQLLETGRDFLAAGLVWGEVQGNATPKILLVALAPGHWELSEPARLDELAIGLLAELPGDEWPVFAHLKDEANEQRFALLGADGTEGTHGVDEVPGLEVIRDHVRRRRDPTFKWSMQTYTQLMHQLDAFHEQVYQTVKDRVADKNEIIEEVAKLLFLESFRCHQDPALTFDDQGQRLNFREVFSARYVKDHGAAAVTRIQAAFDQFKGHPDYVVTADDGTASPIFDDKTFLRLVQPRNYIFLLNAMQDLGPVTDNEGKVLKAAGTLADISGDVLGRVFDVFLRANFESKGGLGVYLTPNPVKQAMLDIAFHDLAQDQEAIQELVAGSFRFCDPTCGSYGFGSVALSRLRALIQQELPLPDSEKEQLFQHTVEQGFIGADSAPRMVMLARVNMALQGAPKAKIFYTENSLSSRALKPNSISLICTNPPFGTPKFRADRQGQASKENYETQMEQILGGFRPAELVVADYNAYYDHTRMEWMDTGDLYQDADGHPIWAGYRTDLRNCSTGKKPRYELHPSTGGLALGSKPDNKGHWKQVKGGSIDPAVLFIDRCLQLLKPGGRLLIVLPDGILCNSGDRYVREYIMGRKDEETGDFVGGKAIVKAVISLPADTFKLSGTGAKTSILYLQKRRASKDDPNRFLPEPQTDVFMAVADTLGYLVKNNVEDYSAGVPNDLDKIVGAYRRGE